MSSLFYIILVLAQSAERLFELRIARRNAAWARERGGVEFGAGHYPVMVLLHTGFLAACLAEALLLETQAPLPLALGALVAVLLTNALRYWVIATLGPQWNTRVLCVPGGKRITHGPFRWLKHPNYLAVAVELFALPLVGGAWRTALVFGGANLLLLAWRLRIEERALQQMYPAEAAA